MDAAIYRMDSYKNSNEGLAGKSGDRLQHVLRLQNTIARPVTVEGIGYWTGEDVRLEFRQGEPDSGIVFLRTDLPDIPKIPALAANRDPKPRQTSLVAAGARVDMVEHVLAALRGLRIDNCEIHANRPEMPGLDGSSMPFVLALEEAGIVPQPAVRALRIITRTLRVGDVNSWIEVGPNSDGVHSIDYTLAFAPGHPIADQYHHFVMQSDHFQRDLMNCRTFLTKTEADQLLAQGLCRRVKASDLLVFDKGGPIDNHLHYENECARHKILDMIGDFALAPCDWIGSFTAHRSGHALNAECVARLEEQSLLIDEDGLPHDCELMIQRSLLQKKCA